MSYANRTWNSITEALTTWVTEAPDPTGVSFPGPGVFGVDTEGYSYFALPGGGGGGGVSGYVVGFVGSGHTLGQDCTYLDTGNGAQFAQAVFDCDSAGGGEVVVLVGAMDFNLPGSPTNIILASFVDIRGSGKGVTQWTMRSSGEAGHIGLSGGSLSGMSILAPAPTAAMSVLDGPVYIQLFDGAFMEYVDIVGDGASYTLTEVGYQAARAMVICFATSCVRKSQLRDMPPIASLLNDPAERFAAIYYWGAGF